MCHAAKVARDCGEIRATVKASRASIRPSARLTRPVERAFNRAEPRGVKLLALMRVDAWLPPAVDDPVRAQLADFLPEPHGQPRTVRGAQRRCLRHAWPNDRNA